MNKKIKIPDDIAEIKRIVNTGVTVYSSNDGYIVKRTNLEDYVITFIYNGYCIGLHGLKGSRYENQLNGSNFYYYEEIE